MVPPTEKKKPIYREHAEQKWLEHSWRDAQLGTALMSPMLRARAEIKDTEGESTGKQQYQKPCDWVRLLKGHRK